MSTYKLKRKFLFVYLLSILPFLIFVFFIFDNWIDARRQTFLQKNLQIAVLVSASSKHFLDNSIAITQTLADDPVVKELKKDETKVLFSRVLPRVTLAQNLLLADKDGNIITFAKISPENPPSFSVKDRPYFQELLSTKKPVISNLIINRALSLPTIVVASPIFSKDNKLIGAILLDSNLNMLKEDFEHSTKIKRSTQIFLLDKNGEIILKTGNNNLTEKERQVFKNDSKIQQSLDGKESVLDGYKNILFTDPVSGVAVPVEKYGWSTIIAGPIENQLEPVIGLQKTFFAVTILAIIFAILLITYFIRKFLPFI